MSEADFRRAFELALRPHAGFLTAMLTMARAGVPDLHLIDGGLCFWLELKVVDTWPVSESANVLEHRFTGPQVTFLRKVDAAGGLGLGVVGWREGHKWVCVFLGVDDIGAEGTIARRQLHDPLTLLDGRGLLSALRSLFAGAVSRRA